MYHVVAGNSGTAPGGRFLSASSSSSPAAANLPAGVGAPSWERTCETKSGAAATINAFEREIYEDPLPPHSTLEGGSSYGTFGERGGREGSPSPSDLEDMKAKITAHPRYSTLVEAYIECQQVINLIKSRLIDSLVIATSLSWWFTQFPGRSAAVGGSAAGGGCR